MVEPSQPAQRRRPPGASTGIATACALLLCGVAYWAANRAWVDLRWGPAGSQLNLGRSVAGSQMIPALPALCAAGALGTLLGLLLSGRARKVVGLLVVACAAGLVVLTAGWLRAPGADAQFAAILGSGARYTVTAWHRGWPVLVLASSLALGCLAALALRRPAAGAQPQPGPQVPAGAEPGANVRSRPATTARQLWDALDRGEDPTG